MSRTKFRTALFLALCALAGFSGVTFAQGVTTAEMTGIIRDAQGGVMPGVTVTAVHQPSGTSYESVSQADGRFFIPGMRVGGPYRVAASLTGYAVSTQEGVFLNLGVAADLSFTMQPVTVEGTLVTVEADSALISSSRQPWRSA